MANNDAVAADELRIMVEMGNDFTPSAEMQTALDDLRSVLETESSEVQMIIGFGSQLNDNAATSTPVISWPATRREYMDDQEQIIGSNELAVVVEMGDKFEPGSRTAAALSELQAALSEEHGDDVAGFGNDTRPAIRSFAFTTSPDPKGFFESWPCK